MYFFPLEATYFIASDLSVLGKKVGKLHDKHEQCFFDNPPFYSVINVIKYVATFIRTGDLSQPSIKLRIPQFTHYLYSNIEYNGNQRGKY